VRAENGVYESLVAFLGDLGEALFQADDAADRRHGHAL
jgi:hypothetical protein